MEKRKVFSIERTLLVLFLTIIIFSIGVYIGNYGTEKKLNYLNEMYNDLRIETQETELEYEIAQELICDQSNFLSITKSLDEWALKLDFMEGDLGKNDASVLNMKRYYYILEMKHWLLAKKQLNNCNISKNIDNSIILYFYSNDGSCDGCERQGVVLSHLKKKYKNIKIYSFDINYNSVTLNALKMKYNIKNEAPTLIINDIYHLGFLDVDSLEKFIIDNLN